MDRPAWDLRLTWAAAGLAWFLWLGVEDRGLSAVFVVAGLVCWAIGLSALRRRGRRSAWVILIGLGLGGGVPLTAIVLMSLKVSLHSHPEPDFTLADVRAALSRTPLWALAGLMAGAAAAILRGGHPSRGHASQLWWRDYNGPSRGRSMFMCRICLLADDAATPCPRCGRERRPVRPGEAADPVRRPLIDAQGNIRTRAPLWWLRETVADLARWFETP